MSAPSFTIGIEEEYQTIDRDTYDLRLDGRAEVVRAGIDRLVFLFDPDRKGRPFHF